MAVCKKDYLYLASWLGCVVGLALPSLGVGAILSFEDLNPAPASFSVMPAPYNGFTFTGWFYGPDTVYSASSGSIDLFTDYADPQNPLDYVITNNNAISAVTPFIFDGAMFSGDSGVKLELYLAGNLVHTSASLPDSSGSFYAPTLLASGYAGQVDMVKVRAVQGYYSMDDFAYHTAAVVPEPASCALVMLELGLLAFVAKRRKQVRQNPP